MKDWTVEQAVAAQRAFTEAGGKHYDPAGPAHQWLALKEIDVDQKAYEGGYSFALLDAVALCAMHKLVMPDWVLRAYLERYQMVAQYKVKTLDEAFGTCLPKGAKLAAHRQSREKGLSAYQEVKRLHDEGEPIDENLFNKAGGNLGIGGSKVRDYYYRWKEFMTYKKPAE